MSFNWPTWTNVVVVMRFVGISATQVYSQCWPSPAAGEGRRLSWPEHTCDDDAVVTQVYSPASDCRAQSMYRRALVEPNSSSWWTVCPFAVFVFLLSELWSSLAFDICSREYMLQNSSKTAVASGRHRGQSEVNQYYNLLLHELLLRCRKCHEKLLLGHLTNTNRKYHVCNIKLNVYGQNKAAKSIKQTVQFWGVVWKWMWCYLSFQCVVGQLLTGLVPPGLPWSLDSTLGRTQPSRRYTPTPKAKARSGTCYSASYMSQTRSALQSRKWHLIGMS